MEKKTSSRALYSVYSALIIVGGAIGIAAVLAEAPLLIPIISVVAVVFGIVSIMRLRQVCGVIVAVTGIFVLVVMAIAWTHVSGSVDAIDHSAYYSYVYAGESDIWRPLAIVAGTMMVLFGALLALAKPD
jgi:hypothetical protein